jgi:hypothetical protein
MRCGHRVVVGGDKSAMTLLASEFPELQVLRIPDIPICYSRFFPAWVVIFLQVPKFIFGIIREHYLLKNIIRTVQADIIISDNRYGLWNKDVISILISHQLSPRLPARMKLLEPFLARLIGLLCKPFDYIWIPDIQGSGNLSGALSKTSSSSLRVRHIGLLSRFRDISMPVNQPTGDELLIILSGPEPQRTVLQEILVSQAGRYPGKILIVAGEINKTYSKMVSESCRIVSSMKTEELLQVMYHAKYIICRSGYSGIMDLIFLGKKALLVPTPGQTEQEYLACYLQTAGYFPYMKQREFDIIKALDSINTFSYRSFNTKDGLFHAAISEVTVSG